MTKGGRPTEFPAVPVFQIPLFKVGEARREKRKEKKEKGATQSFGFGTILSSFDEWNVPFRGHAFPPDIFPVITHFLLSYVCARPKHTAESSENRRFVERFKWPLLNPARRPVKEYNRKRIFIFPWYKSRENTDVVSTLIELLSFHPSIVSFFPLSRFLLFSLLSHSVSPSRQSFRRLSMEGEKRRKEREWQIRSNGSLHRFPITI